MVKPIHETALRPARPNGRFRMTPHGMDRDTDITSDQFEAVQRISLGVFTDMTNNSYSLSETLAAIYLTGAHHAVSVLKGEE